jgi:serine/threonine-protein kinase
VELAQKACQRAAELNDLLAPVHVTLGLLHAETGRNEEALGDFGRALALDPMSSEALREKALSYERLGRLADAETTLKRAIEVKPSYWAGYNSLGGYLFRRGRYPEAVEAFQKVIALTPDNEVAYSNLGGIFVLMERYAEAEVALGKALQLHSDPDALSNLGTCQYFQGRYADAARTFEAVVKQRDTDATLWRNLAAAYYWSPGERDKAAGAYRRSVALAKRDLELDPHDAVTLAYVADAYAMLGEGAAARRFAGEALAAAAGDLNVLFVVGQLYEQLGDRKRALELIGRALAAGYSASQIERAPALARLRADPGFKQALEQSRQGGR